jgi:hypothetical protein
VSTAVAEDGTDRAAGGDGDQHGKHEQRDGRSGGALDMTNRLQEHVNGDVVT